MKWIEGQNNFTRECDTYFNYSKEITDFHVELDVHTYILLDSVYIQDGILVFRFPGATRGWIRFNEDYIITEIQLNPGYPAQCYRPEIVNIFPKYIGRKIDLSNNSIADF